MFRRERYVPAAGGTVQHDEIMRALLPEPASDSGVREDGIKM